MSTKKRFLFIILGLLFSILLIVGVSFNFNKENKKLINNFFELYFEQMKYTKEQWLEIDENVQVSIVNIDNENDINNKTNYNEKIELKKTKYLSILSKKEWNRLIKERLIPNYNLKDLNNIDYKIEKIQKKDKNTYEVDILFYNIKNTLKNTSCIFTVVVEKENNKRKIDYVDFSDFIKNIETIKKYN